MNGAAFGYVAMGMHQSLEGAPLSVRLFFYGLLAISAIPVALLMFGNVSALKRSVK